MRVDRPKGADARREGAPGAQAREERRERPESEQLVDLLVGVLKRIA